jgi:hypothetical protein
MNNSTPRKILCVALATLFAGCLSIFALARQTSEERRKAVEARILNIQPAPFTFEVATSNEYEFSNQSSARFVGFSFGCVQDKKDSYEVIETRPEIEVDLKPQESLHMIGDHGFPEEFCEKGKLAVVRVKFDNGKSWELKAR